MAENNTNLTGDEARALMAALLNSTAVLPSNMVLQLYFMLSNLSNVQPKQQ